MSDKFHDSWTKPVTRIGTIMVFVIIALSFLPVVYLKVRFGVFPDWATAFSSWMTIAAIFGVFYFVEPISYYPILGLAGTYMSFTCGSICDIRMPASSIAQEATGVEFGSKEGQIISTLGIAGSVFTSLIIVFIAAVAGTQLITLLPEFLVTGLKLYTVPAIFGAIYVQFCKYEPKLSSVILITTVLFLLLSKWYGLMMLVSVIAPVIISRFLYKAGVFN